MLRRFFCIAILLSLPFGDARADSTGLVAKYDRVLQVRPKDLEPDCGKIEKITVVSYAGKKAETDLRQRAKLSFGAESEFLFPHLAGAHVLMFFASKDLQRPYLIVDVFHFETAEWVEKAELFVRRKLGTLEPGYVPHMRTFRNADSLLIMTRSHPDEFPVTLPRGLGDPCMASVQVLLRSALQTLSPIAKKEQAASVDLARYIHGKAFDSLRDNDLDDQALSQLGSYSLLQEVAISGDNVTPRGYAQVKALPNLQLVSFGPGIVGDAGMDALKGLSKLRVVRVGYCRITDRGLDGLQGLANLEEVSLRGNEITGTGLKNLSAARNLETLGLNWNPITDDGLRALPPLSQLTTLFLADTSITDGGLSELARFPALEYVVLRRTHITDVGLRTLAHLQHLSAVEVTNTEVTQKGIEAFHEQNKNTLVISEFSTAEERNRLQALERRLNSKK